MLAGGEVLGVQRPGLLTRLVQPWRWLQVAGSR